MQRPSRHLEGSAKMTREKRALDLSDGDDHGGLDSKRQKVPALASVIVEALKVDSLQKLCSSLEPVLRRVVSEEVERALAKMVPSRLGARVRGEHMLCNLTSAISLQRVCFEPDTFWS